MTALSLTFQEVPSKHSDYTWSDNVPTASTAGNIFVGLTSADGYKLDIRRCWGI